MGVQWGSSVLPTARQIAHGLVVPHGFTLVLGGTLAMLVGERGYPGFAGIWLFVVGANGALLSCLAVLKGHRHASPPHPSNMGIYNFVPSLAAPLGYFATLPVHNRNLAFTCAGVLSVLAYVLVLGCLVAFVEAEA